MDTEEETPGADESSDTSLIVLSSGEEGGDSSEWESETNEGEESYIEEREEREEKREAGDYSVGEERSDDEESVSLSSDKEGQQDSQLKLIRSEEDIMEDELGLGVGEEPVPLSRIEAEEAEQSALEHNDPSHHLHLPRQSEDISTQLEEVGQDEDTQRRRSQRLRDRSASPTIRATPIPTVTVACQDTPASPVVQNPPNTQPRPSTTSIPLNSTSTTLPRHDPRTSTPNSPYIPKSRFRTESIRSVASTAPATPAPADASASPHMNRRILDALRVPGLEETLARLQGLPGADVFFARLDEILAASNAVSTDQANEGAMHVDLDLDLDLEDRAHALEKETRRMRMELQDSRAALAMRGASGSTAENAPIHMDASLKDTLARLNREVAEARADLQGCEAEKRGLGALVAGRLRQLEDCAREMDAMRGDLARARERADVEAHVAASAQTETHRLALEAQTLRQSADRAAADALWLRDELARRDEALRSLRAQKAEADAAALARVEEAEAGWKAGAGRVRAVTGRAEAAEAQVQELMRSVEVERERRVSGEAALRNEMGAALRLVELHKADAARAREEAGEMKALIAEAERRCDVVVVERQEVERRVEELESLLKERDAAVVDLNRRCAVLDERAVGALETEAVGVLSPAAAAATALRKSGKSFTQVYVDYIALQDANARLTDEVGELHDSLNGVLSDLAERAPGIQQLASDKTLLEDEVTRLCSELQSAQLALNEDASSRDKAAALEKLNAVLEQEAHDLGRQVCHLLLELEGLRGGFGGSPTARLDRADPAAGSASGRVISERLVLFDNLVELQSQNRSLRSSLRSVSEALARVEGDVAGQVEERVEREMLESVGVLEEVREQLRAANARCETLVGEVEALRAAGEGAVVAGSFGASRFGTSWGSRPGTPGVGSRFGGDEFPLRAVQAEFDDYKLQSSAEIKKMRDAHENLSHAKTDLDVRATRLQTSLDGLTERNRLLTSQLDDARAEATQLRTEADARMRSLSASETRLADLGTQVADLRATLDAKEGEIRLLRAERDSLAVKEAALVAENGSMLGVQGDLREQLARLQKMFDDCDRDKRELGMQSREKIQALEGQIDMIRAQLVAAQDDARIRSLRYETSIGDARYQIERLNAQLADAVRIREVTQVDAARIQQHANDLQSRLMAAEQEVHQLNAQLQTPQSEQLREARAEVSKLRSDLAAAEVAVEAQRAHSEQYKAIAAASESNLAERLAEFSATYDRFKEETEEKVRVLEGDKSQAERLKREAEASLQSLGERLSREKSGLLAELVSLKTVHADLESKAGRLENAERASVTIQSLHDELSALQSRLNESRGAYERVVANEAERIKDVGKLKGDLEAARNEASNLSEQLFSLEAEFHAREGVLVLTKSKLDSELDALKKANEDLLVQNRILHNQFETISVRVTAVYDASRDDGTFSQLSSNENEEHERLELIRHLRRDKDTLAHECELSRQTIENLRQQNNLLQKSLDEARAKLEQELQSNRSVKEIEALHKELLGKIDRVNVLTESNSTLRHSNNVMSRELEVLKSRLKEKELENTPLIEQNNNLLAENDAFKEQVNHLQAENAKLLGRANEILGKHNRVDPAEHQALKDEVLSLKEKLSQAELRVTASLDDFATFKRSSESQAASHAGQMFEIKERLKGAQAETEKLRRDLDGKKHEIVRSCCPGRSDEK
ncbi:hypothetical protein BC830DRAFT_581062 [Chytriomyces sp. MP71]|nr:hypothetical protein BC830DRAFT_581062 [Chytriomyces sp. MP71]